MKHSFTVVCILASAIGAGSVALTNPAAAQSTEPPSAPGPAGRLSSGPAGPGKIAVILFQQAVAQTNEGQRNFSSLQQKFEPKQAALKTESDEIDSLKKQLQTAGANLSDTERASRTRTIDDKTKELQRNAQDDQSDFTSEMNDVYQTLAQKVYAVMDAYAKQQGYTVILDASTSQQAQPVVLWVNPTNDITKAVVEAYNAKSGVPAPSSTAAPRTGATRPSTARPGATHPAGSTKK